MLAQGLDRTRAVRHFVVLRWWPVPPYSTREDDGSRPCRLPALRDHRIARPQVVPSRWQATDRALAR